MKQETIVRCCQCHQPIISGEAFVRFKLPTEQTYRSFHYRFREGDCWQAHLDQAHLDQAHKTGDTRWR